MDLFFLGPTTHTIDLKGLWVARRAPRRCVARDRAGGTEQLDPA
eukprot:COSAG03_NODE_3624_length_1916_cov_10.438635_2_plen_44_part_00